MKYEDLSTKTADELSKTLLDLKKQQMELRFKHVAGQQEKTHEIRALRRDIAKVQTAMNAPKETTSAKAKKAPAAKKATTKKATKAA